MRKRAAIYIGICALAILFSYCSRKDKPMDIPQMKFVMWDMMKADEWYTEQTQKDTAMERRGKRENLALYAQVFKVHGITREQFYNSYRYYEEHPVEMKILLDSMEHYSNRELNRMSENHGQAKK